VLKYECGECSRECKEGMFGSCNGVLEIDVTYLIATVSSLSVLFSGDIDSFSGFHKFHRFPYLILPKVS